MAYRNYSVANGFVVDQLGNGDFTTISAAITAAKNGMTIFIRPGTYLENPNVSSLNATITSFNLTAFSGDGFTGNVILNGTFTLSTACKVTISGIQLQTNGSTNAIIVSGSVASVLDIANCNLNFTSFTGISFSSSSGSSQISVVNCMGNLGTTGIGYFTVTGGCAGAMVIDNCVWTNTGASLTTSTFAGSGQFNLNNTLMLASVTYSSTNVNSGIAYSLIEISGTIGLTTSGTGNIFVTGSYFTTGTSSGISVGAGTTLIIDRSNVFCTATNAITGAGTIQYQGITFNGSATATNTINVTTQTISGTMQGSKNTAPTAGFLGEQIRSFVNSAGRINISNNTPTNITSMNLTAGIWDVTGIAQYFANGATGFTASNCSISTTSATQGTEGDSLTTFTGGPTATSDLSVIVPAVRLTLTTTTPTFLVGFTLYSAGTAQVFGRISATRVG